MHTDLIQTPRESPWALLAADGFLVVVAIVVPLFAPVSAVGLIVAGLAGRLRKGRLSANRYLYDLSMAVGVTLLVVVILAASTILVVR